MTGTSWREALADYPAVRTEELPPTLRRLVGYMSPYAVMFPEDFLVEAALCFYSAFWQPVRFDNLGLNLWGLFAAPPGSGRTTNIDELYFLTRDVGERIAGAEGRESNIFAIFTQGTPEGMARTLEGRGKSLLAYHAEYQGFLAQVRQQPGAKEGLCNLYDGRDYAEAGIEALNPYAVVVALATPTGLERVASRDDLRDGYLSRFLFCATDVQYPPTRVLPGQQGNRDAIAGYLCDRTLARRGEVKSLAFTEDGTLAYEGYRAELGLGPGRKINQDTWYETEALPPVGLLARTKKVAGLLALAGGAPAADGTLSVNGDEVNLAVRVVQRGHAYAQRVGGWLDAYQIAPRADRVLDVLQRHWDKTGEPLDSRTVQQRTRYLQSTASMLLTELLESGEVEVSWVGRKAFYRPVVKKRRE